MLLVDFECPECDNTFEDFVDSDVTLSECPYCHHFGKRIISASGSKDNLVDSPWIATVREVVEKGSGKPHCEQFLKNPTRKNYETWRQTEGLRHLEPGEPMRPPPADTSKLEKEMLDAQRKRNRIEV